MVSELTGLPIANASLLDEAPPPPGHRPHVAREKKGRGWCSMRAHPQVLPVAAERARAIDLEVAVEDLSAELVGEDYCGVVIAYPGTEGDITDPRPVIDAIHERGGQPRSPIPGAHAHRVPVSWGRICVGSSQRFGVPLFYGGQRRVHGGVRRAQRQIRAASWVSPSTRGAPAYRLALQTREQHTAASARRPTSAPRRPCWRSPPPCTRSTTARRGSRASRSRSTAWRGFRRLGGGRAYDAFFDTVAVEVADAHAVVDTLADAGTWCAR